MAMLSSCAPRLQLVMTTWSHDSGSQPSGLEEAVLGPVPTPPTVTFLQSVGWICQNFGFFSVTPWMRSVSQLYGSMNVERAVCPEPGNSRWAGSVIPLAMRDSRYARSEPLFQDEVAFASRVPLPV